MSSEKDTDPPTSPDEGEGSNNKSSVNLPNISLPKELPSLKDSLSQAVQATNRALASAEETVTGMRERLSPLLHQASETATTVASTATDLYEHRKEYGPVTIGGTSIVTGAVVTLRRGKLPGLVAATLASAATYGVIYGLEGLEMPKYGGGKKD